MTLYRFDQIASNITVRVEPSDTDLERYVGLEHLDPESLKIRRWGSPDDVIGQKLRFWVGDIVYGRRRAYQRKLAVADFDGICSAHALVLRAKPEVCLPEFLPFFLQSELFHQRALEISVGSLSPTINWKTLAKQEFPLPPVDEQRRIADLLWAADDVIVRNEEAISALRKVKQAIASSFFENNSTCPRVKLGDLSLQKPQYGANAPATKYEDGLPRFIRITDIDEYGELGNDVVSLKHEDWQEYLLEDGDFMFARTGATVGKTYIYKPQHGLCVFAGYLVRFKLNQSLILPEYLFAFTKSVNYERWIKNTVRVGAQPNINATEYSNMEVPTPSVDEQKAFLKNIDEVETRIKSYIEHQKISFDLKKQMISNFIG